MNTSTSPKEKQAVLDGPKPPLFAQVGCSQCGGSFGPGDQGYSHCDQHVGGYSRAAAFDAWQTVAAVIAARQAEREKPPFDPRKAFELDSKVLGYTIHVLMSEEEDDNGRRYPVIDNRHQGFIQLHDGSWIDDAEQMYDETWERVCVEALEQANKRFAR